MRYLRKKSGFGAALTCTLAVAGSAPAWSAGTDDPVAVRTSTSTCRDSSAQCVLLRIDYAARAEARPRRPPLNVALVLDTSASMAEAHKLPYALDAARVLIENLTDRDVFSLVAFSNQAIVLAGAGRVVNKAFLLHRLDEIVAENYTNLSAGLLEGIAQIRTSAVDGQVQRVFVLTDGQANRGETAPGALRRMVEKAKGRSISVSTFGLGTEFNEKLLADLSMAGGGRYTYVGTPEQIPLAFEDELHGMVDVVAQNATLDLAVQGGRISKVYGRLLDEPTSSYKLVIADVRAAERGFLLARLQFDSDAMLQADVRLTFDDPLTGTRFSPLVSVHVPQTIGSDDPSVSALAAILEAMETAEIAAQGLDVEEYRSARNSFERLYVEARAVAIRNRDQELLNQTFILKHFMEELAAAESAGLLHGHQDARARLTKESHYLRYLSTHHRPLQP